MKHSLSISLARQLGVLPSLLSQKTFKDIDCVMGGFVNFEGACVEWPHFIVIPDMRFGILPALQRTEGRVEHRGRRNANQNTPIANEYSRQSQRVGHSNTHGWHWRYRSSQLFTVIAITRGCVLKSKSTGAAPTAHGSTDHGVSSVKCRRE